MLLLLVCACSAIDGDGGGLGALVPEPPTIEAAEAADYVGEFVSVRAVIASTRIESGNVLLEPAGSTPGGLVIEIVPPLVGPGADQLAARYEGQRVVATGRISDFGGKLELLVGDPARVRLDPSGVAGSSAGAARDVGTASAGAGSKAGPESGNRAGTTTEVAASGTAAEPAECADARLRLEEASKRARPVLASMLGCLESGRVDCTGADGEARRALADLAAAEERLRWVCGDGR